MEAVPPADEAAKGEMVVETAVEEAETVLKAEKEAEQEVESPPPPAPAATSAAAATPAAAAAAEEATAELGLAMEAPAEAAPVEEEMAADEGEALVATSPARAESDGAPTPSATPAPMATTTPPPAAEPMPATASPTPTLLEVEDLDLEIEPGIIRARGRLSLPEGRKLLAVLWRDGQPIEWATIESRRLVVEADGSFYLVLLAQAEVPDLDLFAAKPANYEIRIRPVDPSAPVEIRIPFDTYGPPPPTPTSRP
jgi:hypothetical protein